MKNKRPLVLCILDGFGISNNQSHNAVFHANMNFYNELLSKYPHNILLTSGNHVGLPHGQMGNSEVGHLTIGAGRVMLQDLPRINKSFETGAIKENIHIKSLIRDLQNTDKICHLMGLFSDGGVHSHIDHILNLAKILSEQNVKVYIHAFTDGRDTEPDNALTYFQQLEKLSETCPNIKIATISGRYYSMDRDNRWDRIEKAYQAIINANAKSINHIDSFIKSNHEAKIYDEFIEPHIVGDYAGVKNGDAIIMANFRSDRARQLLDSIVSENFSKFTTRRIELSHKIGFTKYADYLNLDVLFPSDNVEMSLGEVISLKGYKQLRVAETEKYAHVSFFFNGGREEIFEGEDRKIIPSPQVENYELKPEMSAYELTEFLTKEIFKKKYELIVVNYANPDMVGHTGDMEATIKALKAIDSCLKSLVSAILENDYQMIITSDHGNAESMFDEQNGKMNTAHTTNPVPFILVNNEKNVNIKHGTLADIAPTILELLEIEKPALMTGKSLIKI